MICKSNYNLPWSPQGWISNQDIKFESKNILGKQHSRQQVVRVVGDAFRPMQSINHLHATHERCAMSLYRRFRHRLPQ